MKKTGTILLTLALLFAFCFVGTAVAEETRTFVDDVGREITAPVTVDSVSPSGPLAQIVLYSLDPDMFASIAAKFTDDQLKYIDPRVAALPITGQFYGSKASTMNPEEIMDLNKELHIDVVLDIGEAKGTMKQDLDEIQKKTGISFGFITQNNLSDIPGSYIRLGELLSRPERGQELSSYTAALLNEFEAGMKKVGAGKKSLICVTGIKGNSVHLIGSGENSYHGEVINYLGNNLAHPPVSSSGLGDEYTMEDILRMNPDYIIVSGSANHEIYHEIHQSCMWQSLPAVKNGQVFESPKDPYSWMGGPPSVNRLLSMIWLGNLFYPDVFSYDMDKKIPEYYALFYQYNLTSAELDELMVHAKPHAAPIPTNSPVPVFGIFAGAAVAAVFAGWRF